MDNSLVELIKDIGDMPSVVENPFSRKYITSISTWASPSIWDKDSGKWEYSATVRFKRGDTKGEQEIKGESFTDLFTKLAEFCNSL